MLQGHTNTVRCLKFTDSGFLVSASRDATLRLWELKTGACIQVLEGHESTIRDIAVYGNVVISGSYDGTVRVWDIGSGKCLYVLGREEGLGKVYTVVGDAERVVAGDLRGVVCVWEVRFGYVIIYVFLGLIHGLGVMEVDES